MNEFDCRDGYKLSAVCEPTHHSTMVFNTFMLMQLFNQFNCRCLQDRNIFRGLFDGYPVLLCAWTACIVIQVRIHVIVLVLRSLFLRIQVFSSESFAWSISSIDLLVHILPPYSSSSKHKMANIHSSGTPPLLQKVIFVQLEDPPPLPPTEVLTD